MTTQEILTAVASGKLSATDAASLINTNGGGGMMSLKVSEKGAISVRGIKGISVKFGLTMYAVAFEELFANREKIEAFIKANAGKLSRK